MSNHIDFDYYGQPEVNSLPIFGSQIGDSGATTLTFTNAGGMCGRYVLVFREILNEYLLIFEIQGIGYAFG